ncbi:MAG: ABC transporter permease, partial [Proteobacteria bacterium]|nr:ABC transporter permease [Pseudomonadota bacterium]
AAILNYLLVNVMRPTGSMDPATAKFSSEIKLPSLHDILEVVGISFSKAGPANVSFFIALAACVFVWLFIWHTRWGYQIRAFGHSESAAVYAGILPFKIIMVSMLISGALAGMMAINNVMGEAERLIMNSTEGAGFIGIAVALMGRNHPLGVLLAALLFGFLYQGGAELAMWTTIPRELIVVIQALVILFTGALENMVRTPLEWLWIKTTKGKG